MEILPYRFWKYASILLAFLILLLEVFGVDGVRGGGGRPRYRRSYRHVYTHSGSGAGSTGSVLGIVVGCLFAFVLIVGGIVLCCICYRRPKSRRGQTRTNGGMTIATNGVLPPSYTESQMTVYNTAYDNTMEKTEVPPGGYPPTYTCSGGEFVPPPPYEPVTKY